MPNKDFEDFKKYFKHYQQFFGLTGYKVYFKYESWEGDFADITVKQGSRVALVRFNQKQGEFKHIKDSAKHEALHLLLDKLEGRAVDRYITHYDIGDEIEELVNKLEELIKD